MRHFGSPNSDGAVRETRDPFRTRQKILPIPEFPRSDFEGWSDPQRSCGEREVRPPRAPTGGDRIARMRVRARPEGGTSCGAEVPFRVCNRTVSDQMRAIKALSQP